MSTYFYPLLYIITASQSDAHKSKATVGGLSTQRMKGPNLTTPFSCVGVWEYQPNTVEIAASAK